MWQGRSRCVRCRGVGASKSVVSPRCVVGYRYGVKSLAMPSRSFTWKLLLSKSANVRLWTYSSFCETTVSSAVANSAS